MDSPVLARYRSGLVNRVETAWEMQAHLHACTPIVLPRYHDQTPQCSLAHAPRTHAMLRIGLTPGLWCSCFPYTYTKVNAN
jgi:hypothetical protein